MVLDDIKLEIEKSQNIVILTHEMPDGDAVGSSLAMYLYIKSLNKNVDIIVPEISRVFSFLPCINEMKSSSNTQKYDLAIAVDCADMKRMNGFITYFENARKTISIDHHSGNAMFGDINYVNPVSPATCQILASMFKYWGVEINDEIGTCLITGIITDTGGFKYKNVTVETFELAAEFLAQGINISKIYESVMQIISKTRFELAKIALNRLELHGNGQIAFTYINIEDEKQVNSEFGDHEGIVEQGRCIEGVEVSIFLRQTENGYKVSLRANEHVNVADVCAIFGGGGHKLAAGCFLPYNLDDAKDKIITEVKKWME